MLIGIVRVRQPREMIMRGGHVLGLGPLRSVGGCGFDDDATADGGTSDDATAGAEDGTATGDDDGTEGGTGDDSNGAACVFTDALDRVDDGAELVRVTHTRGDSMGPIFDVEDRMIAWGEMLEVERRSTSRPREIEHEWEPPPVAGPFDRRDRTGRWGASEEHLMGGCAAWRADGGFDAAGGVDGAPRDPDLHGRRTQPR